jgi:hypothetical protein
MRFSIFPCIELPKNDTQFMRHGPSALRRVPLFLLPQK